jgi:hypothetical protein
VIKENLHMNFEAWAKGVDERTINAHEAWRGGYQVAHDESVTRLARAIADAEQRAHYDGSANQETTRQRHLGLKLALGLVSNTIVDTPRFEALLKAARDDLKAPTETPEDSYPLDEAPSP